MATGETLTIFTANDNTPPTTAFASLDMRNNIMLLDFDDTINESAVFMSVLPQNYEMNGINVILYWTATSAIAGDVLWSVSFDNMSGDIDSDSFATALNLADTCNGTSGTIEKTTISFTDGAEIDNLIIGNLFRVKVTRLASDGSDTMVGDAELLAVELREV